MICNYFVKLNDIDFLGVSSDEYSDEEILLIDLYRKADDRIKKYIFELVKLLMMA